MLKPSNLSRRGFLRLMGLTACTVLLGKAPKVEAFTGEDLRVFDVTDMPGVEGWKYETLCATVVGIAKILEEPVKTRLTALDIQWAKPTLYAGPNRDLTQR